MFEVDVSARAVGCFVELVGAERVESFARQADATRALLGPQAVWNINSTAAGGGVAEMLRSQLRYARGVGVDVHWLVIEGPPEFFKVTKRLHNALHDAAGDGSPLGPEQAALYEHVMEENIGELGRFLRPGDIVICHDPQTAGLVPHLLRMRVRVVWRCHIGHEEAGRHVDEGWAFLRRYLEHVPLAVFTRDAYAPGWLPRTRAVTLPPNIDPFSAKNQWMPELTIRAILSTIGLVAGTPDPGGAVFVRDDGTTGHVSRRPTVTRFGDAPPWSTPLIVQVSRWDRMKDHIGVLEGFARLVTECPDIAAELVLAGPALGAVADDPEGPAVLREVEQAWLALPETARRRVHVVQVPMDDTDENAAIVNALQRHAAIIVQKSLREGFGLTVTEAMWKRRPIVASAVGGIRDQIRDGIDGVLVRDPTSAAETAAALRKILEAPELGERLGNAAYERVREKYLSIASLERWAELLRLLLEAERRLQARAPTSSPAPP
jgi:trehalose synthase